MKYAYIYIYMKYIRNIYEISLGSSRRSYKCCD